MHNSNYLANTKLEYIILIMLFMSIKIYLCIHVKHVSIIIVSLIQIMILCMIVKNTCMFS